MKNKSEKKFLLIQVGLGQAKEIYSGSVQICQSKKKELKSQPQYKKFDLQIRTPEGFAAVPILKSKKNGK